MLQDRKPPAPRTRQGFECSVSTILATLDAESPEDAAQLRKWLDGPWRIYTHSWIERELASEGHRVGTGTVGKHRRGDCRCTKSPK